MQFYAGKTIWVIGGTSGIGLSVAENLLKHINCTVIASGRDVTKIASIEHLVKIPLDVCECKSFDLAIGQILEKFQRVDIILFCAGTYEPMGLENFNAKSAAKILQTNLGSMVNFIDVIIPKIIGKCSLIGIISSVAGYFGMPNSLFYGASKAGLSNLTESLYVELKKHNINVKLINPGFVKTPMTDKNSFKMPFITSSERAAEIIVNKLSKRGFEISFPLLFVAILKFIRLLPFHLRAKILTKK